MHLSRAISQYQVAELLNSAYSRVASVGIASKAFVAVGIWPLNHSTFPPSSATSPSLTANDGTVIATDSSGTLSPMDKSQAHTGGSK